MQSEKRIEYYLVFCDSGNKIFNFIFKKGFSHVFFVAKLSKNWVVCDCRQSSFNLNVMDNSFDLPKFYRSKGFTVLRADQHKIHSRKYIPRAMLVLTCVSMAKYALMIKSKAITPWQLYKFLTKKD